MTRSRIGCRISGDCPWKVDGEDPGSELQRQDHEDEHREMVRDRMFHRAAWLLELERLRPAAAHSNAMKRLWRIARRAA